MTIRSLIDSSIASSVVRTLLAFLLISVQLPFMHPPGPITPIGRRRRIWHDLHQEDDATAKSEREVAALLGDTVQHLDVLAGILDYFADWALRGTAGPRYVVNDWNSWELGIDDFKTHTRSDFLKALDGIRLCVRECERDVPDFLAALRRAGTGAAHERIWRALVGLFDLPDNLVADIWESGDAWREVRRDLVQRCVQASTITNRVIPPGTFSELTHILEQERLDYTESLGTMPVPWDGPPSTFCEPVVSAPPPSERSRPKDVTEGTPARQAKRLPTRTPRSTFGEWRFFDDRVEHRGKRIELRRQETLVFEWFVRAGEGGLTREALGRLLEEAKYTAGDKFTVPVSTLAKRLRKEPGWSGYIFEGDGRAGRPRRLVVPPPRR